MEPYWDAVIFALEGDEIFSQSEQEGAIQFLQSEVTDKPVGSHGRFNPATFPRNANFWANEFPWSPLDGDSHSVEETVAIGQWVIAESGVDTWFLEDCWNPIGEMCRRHARALVGLPGVWALERH